MGRCADVILTNNRIPHISIFITAPFEQRVRRMMEVNNLPLKEAVRRLKKIDKGHEQYYHFYTGRKWGDAVNYDLCINSACYGIERIRRTDRARSISTRRSRSHAKEAYCRNQLGCCNMPLFYVYVYFSFILHIIYNCATTIWFSTMMHSYPHYPQSYPHFF